jgi:lipoprotein-releasing system permease protein
VTIRFVSLVALRYFRARRRSSGSASTTLSILGVAVGVMTLTAVLGVMNGFQLGFIESILEVSSYHLQIDGPLRWTGEPRGALPALLEELRSLRGVVAAVPFREEQVIAAGVYADQRGCLIRRVPEDVEAVDPGFRSRLEIVEGSFDLRQRRGLVVGVELARHLGVGAGDAVSVISLDAGAVTSGEPETRTYLVTGLFRTGYYDFDLGLAFASLEDALLDARQEASAASRPGPASGVEAGSGDRTSPWQGGLPVRIGVKIRNRFRDQEAAARIRALVPGGGFRVSSWREFNRAFFGALRTEKVMMMVLVGLIFVVVGFNIYPFANGMRTSGS